MFIAGVSIARRGGDGKRSVGDGDRLKENSLCANKILASRIFISCTNYEFPLYRRVLSG
jgi:hypothetical protein